MVPRGERWGSLGGRVDTYRCTRVHVGGHSTTIANQITRVFVSESDTVSLHVLEWSPHAQLSWQSMLDQWCLDHVSQGTRVSGMCQDGISLCLVQLGCCSPCSEITVSR